MKNLIIVCLIAVSVFLFVIQNKTASAAPTAMTTGRFVPITFPSDYNNFIWVLDSATGKIKSYRLALTKFKGEEGQPVVEKFTVTSIEDYTAPDFNGLFK